ncbi:T9SS type A sorting domain-containing protein [Flavobacterium silvaticum]|uniref:T9SS type A sorting domain-containing protein n=1 Tax=Flavobacterium silvaticum TaxID=1852020 RepID=A0A972JHF0_9FLAO|nr:T9SS type A sorting domain-containing protein [Flavobacterium silvaticum]NMH27855.1 T9SS type A sorting domain-containing protein [Flavobacterium silvaticum]
MKTILLSITLCFLAVFSLNAQIVNIPDPNFKNFLVNHHYNTNPMVGGTDVYLDSNHDGEIQYSEAAVYTSDIYNHAFFLQGLNISDLTGIEAFQGIEWLNIPDNPLTSLNITGCTSLKKLTANYNNLFTTLTLVNPSLEKIDIACPTITAIDLSGCPALRDINCSNSPLLTNFNVNGCVNVQELRFYQDPLLTSINMGNHYYMTLFQCSQSGLTALDLSSCHSLQYLFVTGNPLTSLNLANGNPQSFVQIIASGIPSLTCIKVDNVAVSDFLWNQTGGYYEFDDWATFSTDCTPPGPCVVSIPDANFKARLLDNEAINTNGNDEIECEEAEAYTGSINVDNSGIADMTGIKAFTHLTSLSCNLNNPSDFSSLDVSNMTSLVSVSCMDNSSIAEFNVSGCTALTTFSVDNFVGMMGEPLRVHANGCTALTGFNAFSWTNTSLDLTGCTALTTLDVSYKHVNFLDITNCSNLTNLSCNNNYLTQLGFNGCDALTTVNCSHNTIASLSASDATALTSLDCSFNLLPTLNVLDNADLTVLNCASNQLPYLLVSNNTHLAQLDCNTNNISYLDVNNNPDLSNLNCSHNNLNALNVSSNVALTMFDCSSNNLGSMNVNSNTALLSFNCGYNNISSQNVSANTVLTTFYCNSNNLSAVDVSSNANLKFFNCSSNDLTQLDLSSCPALLVLDCSLNEITGLDFSTQPNLYQLDCNSNQLTTLDLSSTFWFMLNCSGNQLTSLNLANGHNAISFAAVTTNNPGLTCIQVDDADYSTENWTGDNFAFDAVASFNENCALGLAEPSGLLFSVYPNPVNDVLKITTVDANLIQAVKIVDVNGRVIKTTAFHDVADAEVNVSELASGVYLLTVSSDKNSVTKRIVKN